MKIHRLTPAITWIEPASMSNFSACGGLLVDTPTRVGIDTNFGPETAAWLEAARPEILIARREEHIADWTKKGLDDAEIIERGIVYPGHANYKTEFRHLMGYWEEKTLAHHRAALADGGAFAIGPQREASPCT